LGGIGGYQGGDCKEYLGPDSERGCLEYLLLEYRTYILTTVFTIVDCNETFFFRHSTYTSFPLKKKKKKKKKKKIKIALLVCWVLRKTQQKKIIPIAVILC